MATLRLLDAATGLSLARGGPARGGDAGGAGGAHDGRVGGRLDPRQVRDRRAGRGGLAGADLRHHGGAAGGGAGALHLHAAGRRHLDGRRHGVAVGGATVPAHQFHRRGRPDGPASGLCAPGLGAGVEGGRGASPGALGWNRGGGAKGQGCAGGPVAGLGRSAAYVARPGADRRRRDPGAGGQLFRGAGVRALCSEPSRGDGLGRR